MQSVYLFSWEIILSTIIIYIDKPLTFVHVPLFLINLARKRLVASIPWGGEEDAQEEASCTESQLLLHGCEMSRYSFLHADSPQQTSTTSALSICVNMPLFWSKIPVCFLPGCYKITTVFSHAQTVVLCVGCSTVLCQPTGGKARLTEGQYLQY